MITGGLGFIGSNLAHQLVELGADVLLVDSLIPDYGGNLFNIDGIDGPRARQRRRRPAAEHDELPGARPRGHLQPRRPGQPHRQHAGSVHRSRDQLPQPADDARGLPPPQPGASRSSSPARARSTAGPTRCRSTEQHLVRPTDVNGINKAAGEYYHLVYNNVFGVRACSLRLTNVYGPRQLIRHNRQGFIGWFIRLALEDREIQIFGDGSQMRDFVYVDDAADAFLRGGRERRVQRRGVQRRRRRADRHRDLVDAAGRRSPAPAAIDYVEWPAEKKAIDIGSFYADSSQVQAHDRLAADGRRCARDCARTIAFYRAALRPLRRRPARAEPRVTRARASRSCRSRPREDARGRPRGDRARGRAAAGSCSGPRSRRSKREFAAACGARARGRRRHRHRRDRADPARARHRRRATR